MFKVNKEKCIGCNACVNVCPVSAISLVEGKAEINSDKCINCARCAQVCPNNAIYSDTSDVQRQSPAQNQSFGMGRGMGRGFGRGLGRGPRDGRGRGRGGGGRW